MDYEDDEFSLEFSLDMVQDSIVFNNRTKRTSKVLAVSTPTKQKTKRCTDTIDWVEAECGEKYKKITKGKSGY